MDVMCWLIDANDLQHKPPTPIDSGNRI